VLAVDKSADGLNETAASIANAGGVADTLVADCGLEADVCGYVARALANFGGLDVMHANAGILGGHVPLQDQTPELWSEILRVNLIGPFLAIKHASRHMADRGKGSIICTASVAGLKANAGNNAYSASKAGVINLVQTSAYSLAGTGVRVNAICPGLIETGMTAGIFRKARARGHEDRIGELNPAKRYGVPEDIAAMALFLASDESSYANGQAFVVDGGLTASLPYVGRS
jgi:NAD(P)-dependent dehydrogenase (short-subunit alcohol dehydrogenase family)